MVGMGSLAALPVAVVEPLFVFAMGGAWVAWRMRGKPAQAALGLAVMLALGALASGVAWWLVARQGG